MWTPAQTALPPMALQGTWQLCPRTYSQKNAEVFEALHLTPVLAVTVIWLPLSPAKGCKDFSLQPMRLLGWATSKGLSASLLASCLLPALPESGTWAPQLDSFLSPGELCSWLTALCSTDSEPGGRQEDRLACDSAAGLGNVPLPQPLALPIPVFNSREGEGEWGSSAFKDNLQADFLQWFSNKLGYITWVDSWQPQHNRKGTKFTYSSPHKGCRSWKPVE